jgi:hypothetical protein
MFDRPHKKAKKTKNEMAAPVSSTGLGTSRRRLGPLRPERSGIRPATQRAKPTPRREGLA